MLLRLTKQERATYRASRTIVKQATDYVISMGPDNNWGDGRTSQDLINAMNAARRASRMVISLMRLSEARLDAKR